MSRLPVIVGFGGINPAGRVSCHHAYRRTVIDALPSVAADETYRSLQGLMGILPNNEDQASRDYILDHTLVRKIELFDINDCDFQKASTIHPNNGKSIEFSIPVRQLPETIPDGWKVKSTQNGKIEVEVTEETPVLFPDQRKARVTSAGQLPTGFDPAATYPSRNHPRGLSVTIASSSDALHSLGIPWEKVRSHVGPDEIAVFAGSAMGQLDANGNGGMLQAPYRGKRPTSKQIALGLSEMPADFVNAYVLGSVGATGGIIGACATFLYNVKQGVDEIRNGGKRVAMVGGAEAPITPEIVEAYRIMGAVAEDEALMALDGSDVPDNRRACRPFSSNAGFTLAEAGVYLMLMDDELAVELGAEIYGSVPSVFINADGFKKSIPGPGVGNYLTVGKALALTRSILGDDAVRSRSCIHAHGTGTPQNRVTESHILNEMAKVFGIEKWPVAAIKAYLGHTLAAASGDQMTSILGTWVYGWLPGIATIDHIADDVHDSHLRLSSEHFEIDPSAGMDVALVNSKGFGGNNATGVVLSPKITSRMLRSRHGKKAMTAHGKRNESVKDAVQDYDKRATADGIPSIYRFGEQVLEGGDLSFDSTSIEVPGYGKSIDLTQPNPYSDMQPYDFE